MSYLKDFGKAAGDTTGRLIGGSIRVVGEAARNDYIKEVGNKVEGANKRFGTLLGDTLSGTWKAGMGAVTKDGEQMRAGLSEIKDTASDVAEGIGQSFKAIGRNGKDVISGIAHGDKQSIARGGRNLFMIATVGVLAVGVVDLLDGPDGAAAAEAGGAMSSEAVATESNNSVAAETGMTVDSNHYAAAGGVDAGTAMDTINDDLNGAVHPETGVVYESVVVELPGGEWIEGVFPQFDYAYMGELPTEMFLSSDYEQFSYMNEQLAAAVEQDPMLASEFTMDQLTQIVAGDTPDGYVWHHTEVPGQMELVDEETHARSAHTGGRSLWGGGSEFR